MKLPLLAIAAAAAAMLASPALAQDIIASQLDEAVNIMNGNGFAAADEPVLGQLAQGGDEEFELELDAGSNYVVVGVCDGDCKDLDLVLTNGSGDEVTADRELDDVPMLAIEDQSGTFVLTVSMATCETSQCRYGVRVFRSR
jgi:hypothetical protein